MGRQFLIVVDAHSKWAEVIEMKTTMAPATILEVQQLFSLYGLPEQLVSIQQWNTVYLSHEEQWYQTHIQCTIPPVVKWVGRKVCADLQMSHEG